MARKKHFLLLILFSLVFLTPFFAGFVSANTYLSEVYFSVPDSVFVINERIELKGYVFQANYSDNGTLISASAALPNALVNLTIINSNSSVIQNYTFTTDSSGAFYSKSNYYTNSTEVNASSTPGIYKIRVEYKDLNSNISFSNVQISVVNQTLDTLGVSSDKAVYNPSETMIVQAEAIRAIGDNIIYISNVTINGSVRNSTKSILQSFNCTTNNNGKCSVSLTAPSSYGDYFVELNDFKAFGSFSVVPFSFNVYMRDGTTNSLKNIFAMGEATKIEVRINNASLSDAYTFSGYVADSGGNSVATISSTVLNNNNSFINSFQFTIDAVAFSYSTYSVHLTVSKTGDGSIDSISSFQVQDWMLSVDKRSAGSGFEYQYSAFPNKTLRFESIPAFRANGSVIQNITSSSFNVSLKDDLSNVLASTSATWNASCGKSGCYEFSLLSPSNTGKYTLYTTLSYSGDSQMDSRTINVISGVMSAQSTDKDGNLKELFGASEYVYLSLSAYNLTSTSFNLTDAEVFIVSYMNGTEYSYTQANYTLVNSSNSVYEWGWNSSLQRIKIDTPKAGGVYTVSLFGNNRTLGTTTRFIINPYDACILPKDSPNTGGSGYYYVWQFKTSDTIYFEVKLVQANNPLGRATASNATNNGTYGSYGSSGSSNFGSTRQVVNNATLSISEVKNIESGASQAFNGSSSSCQASDTSGGYTCTVKPLSKWDGGQNIVKFNAQGQDGSSSTLYGMFEARAFYMYGWSNTWQNNPTSNISLSVRLYNAGSGWWSGSGSSGLSGTITVKRIEYQGRDGEWIWPPVDSGYNVTNITSATISSGSGNVNLPVSLAPGGSWRTGYYRAVLQATTSSGDTDYGYAWFGVKLWDVSGQPIECTTASCNYKSYFNSKENISLYITINKAGQSWWSSNTGGQEIYGNVSVGIKKIENCKTWPCKEMNASQYTASTINVNSSSPGYWYASINQSNYIIQINSTTGTWNTGYYSVVLNINNTDTGYAWFNTIAFYVEAQPTNSNGSSYVYSIRGNQPMYFNVTTTKSYKWNYYGNSRYNQSDYINVTFDDAVLRTWDQTTYQSKEYTYPEDINITPSNIDGNSLINVTPLNGSWPTGYYWGELSLKNSDNETSSGYLWFNVQPFRVNIATTGNTYSMDAEQCVNSTLDVYSPDWSSSTRLAGNYSITSVYENIWSGSGQSTTYYSNFTVNNGTNSSSFNGTANNVTICPNSGAWGGGSWGGYHYLNIVVKDNVANDSQSGWLSFRAIPFTVSWNPSSFGSMLTSANINTFVNLTKSSGTSASGNLTSIYQWRYDSSYNGKESYRFTVNSSGTYCDSTVSGQCRVNGTANITIYPPSNGWKVGWNYLQAEWTKDTDSSISVQDWSGIYFDGRANYVGYFSNVDSSGNWKYYFAPNENITMRLNVTYYNNTPASNVAISSVEYAVADNCGSESCLSYTGASFSPASTDSNGLANLQIKKSSGNWTKGDYRIRATVSSVSVTGGYARVKEFTPPNITYISITNNATYNVSLSFSATTSKSAQCSISFNNYDNFYNWYCYGWNSTSTNSSNSSSPSAQTIGACNVTKYNYNGSIYRTEYISKDYHSFSDGVNWSSYYNSGSSSQYCYGPDSSKTTTYISTGGVSHTYNLNITGLPAQHYGVQVWCYDDDYNYANINAAFKVNNSI